MKYLALLAIALFAVVAAEPEADADAAAHYYGGYYGHPGYYGYGRYGYGYGRYHGYYGYPYGRYGYAHHYGKRSADAEPEAEAEADPAYLYAGHYGYAGRYAYGAYGYPYSYGYAGYPYAAYYRAPVAVAAAASHQHVSTPAATYGISQVHKRSADAEPEADADAAYYYGGYYGHPGYYGYASRYYGYGGYYGYPYGRYGYRHFGKRSADAEAGAPAAHPGAATSFVARSPQGARGYFHPYAYAPYYGYPLRYYG